MATREEIREEVDRILAMVATGEIPPSEALSRLNNWVVIKVEPPDCIPCKGTGKAGYVATKPLIPLCKTCQGTGLWGGSGINDMCGDCNGTGKPLIGEE